jgi:hypothetical protein
MHHMTSLRKSDSRETQPHSHVILNRVMKLMLRSPFHGVISKRIMLITFTGRKSGRAFTTPVTYVRDGEIIRVFSNQRWWRNLIDGAPVVLRLRGMDVPGFATVEQDKATVLSEIRQFLTQAGVKRAFMINLELGQDGEPTDEQIAYAARGHVVVRVRLQATQA